MHTDEEMLADALDNPEFFVRICAGAGYFFEDAAQELVEDWEIAPDIAAACARTAERRRHEHELADISAAFEAARVDA